MASAIQPSIPNSSLTPVAPPSKKVPWVEIALTAILLSGSYYLITRKMKTRAKKASVASVTVCLTALIWYQHFPKLRKQAPLPSGNNTVVGELKEIERNVKQDPKSAPVYLHKLCEYIIQQPSKERAYLFQKVFKALPKIQIDSLLKRLNKTRDELIATVEGHDKVVNCGLAIGQAAEAEMENSARVEAMRTVQDCLEKDVFEVSAYKTNECITDPGSTQNDKLLALFKMIKITSPSDFVFEIEDDDPTTNNIELDRLIQFLNSPDIKSFITSVIPDFDSLLSEADPDVLLDTVLVKISSSFKWLEVLEYLQSFQEKKSALGCKILLQLVETKEGLQKLLNTKYAEYVEKASPLMGTSKKDRGGNTLATANPLGQVVCNVVKEAVQMIKSL